MRNIVFLEKGVICSLPALSSSFNFAQNKTISDIITGDEEQPLSGAAIAIKNSRVDVTANVAGVFNMTLPA